MKLLKSVIVAALLAAPSFAQITTRVGSLDVWTIGTPRHLLATFGMSSPLKYDPFLVSVSTKDETIAAVRITVKVADANNEVTTQSEVVSLSRKKDSLAGFHEFRFSDIRLLKSVKIEELRPGEQSEILLRD